MIYRVWVVLTLLLSDFTSASNYSASYQATHDSDFKLINHTASFQTTETLQWSLKWTVTMQTWTSAPKLFNRQSCFFLCHRKHKEEAWLQLSMRSTETSAWQFYGLSCCTAHWQVAGTWPNITAGQERGTRQLVTTAELLVPSLYFQPIK